MRGIRHIMRYWCIRYIMTTETPYVMKPVLPFSSVVAHFYRLYIDVYRFIDEVQMNPIAGCKYPI